MSRIVLTPLSGRTYSRRGLDPTMHGTTRARPHEAARPARLPRWVLVAAACLGAPSPALAAKWRHCPSQVRYYPSRTGAMSAPFAHPGHEVGIVLSRKEVAASGGFSTEPGGNTVTVTLASLFGDPIVLPPIQVAAVSRETLYFAFPDTRVVVGRSLAGPAGIRVTTGATTTAEILPRHFLALPPATSVGALVAGDLQQTAQATMDAHGAIWIPVEFSAYGTMQKPMMMCPGEFIPLTAFTVGVAVRSTPILTDGAPPTYPPLRALRRMDVFLGDFLIDGTDYYGLRVGHIPVERLPLGFGIRLCGINDAVDIVLRARGSTRWAKPWSDFAAWMPRSQPLQIVLTDMSADQNLQNITAETVDAFGEECRLP
jgi:hypothetical protein